MGMFMWTINIIPILSTQLQTTNLYVLVHQNILGSSTQQEVSKEGHADSVLGHKKLIPIDFFDKDASVICASYC